MAASMDLSTLAEGRSKQCSLADCLLLFAGAAFALPMTRGMIPTRSSRLTRAVEILMSEVESKEPVS
jgi:hypothetical protein